MQVEASVFVREWLMVCVGGVNLGTGNKVLIMVSFFISFFCDVRNYTLTYGNYSKAIGIINFPKPFSKFYRG